MATIGLSKPYYALYQESGGTVTYSGGGLIGKATEMSLELEGADANILYADNGPAESDNQFAGGTLTISTDDLLPEPMLAILGLVEEEMTLEEASTATPKCHPLRGVWRHHQGQAVRGDQVDCRGADQDSVCQPRDQRGDPGRDHRMADQGTHCHRHAG